MLRHVSLGRLSATLDGELTPAEAAAIAGHLAACDRCAQRLDGLRRAANSVRSLAASLAAETAPPSLHARVRVAVAAGRHERLAGRWAAALEAVLGSVLAATGTAALAAMVVVLYVQPARGFADGGRLRERLIEAQRIERFERLLETGAVAVEPGAARPPQSSGAR
jgi:anti-sigma factor RsiW